MFFRFKTLCPTRAIWYALTIVGTMFTSTPGCDVANPAFYVTPQEIPLGDIFTEGVADEHVVGTFYLVNGLERPVEVTDLRPSCRCSKVTLSPNPIPPGKTGELKVVADIAGMVGQQQFVVNVFTDSHQFPVHRIALNANIRSSKREQGGEFYLGRFWPDTPVNTTVELNLNGVDQIQIKSLDSRGAIVEPSIDVTDHKTAVLRFLGRTAESAGPFWCEATLILPNTTLRDNPATAEEVTIVLHGHCVPRWRTEAEVYLGFIDPTENQGEAVIRLREDQFGLSHDKSLVREVKVDDQASWLVIKDVAIERGDIAITLSSEFDATDDAGPYQSNLTIRIRYHDGKAEVITVRVYAAIAIDGG